MLSQPTGQQVTQVTEKSINQSINQSIGRGWSAATLFRLALWSTPREIPAVACSSRRLEVGAASDTVVKYSCPT